MNNNYDIAIIGAGHAGCEAALAAARLGCKTLLTVINADTIGAMSCNPAIGGLAKGHLVREIDALGGEMARNIDATSIQFRTLNTSKGPAVRSSRAQADRLLQNTINVSSLPILIILFFIFVSFPYFSGQVCSAMPAPDGPAIKATSPPMSRGCASTRICPPRPSTRAVIAAGSFTRM